MRELSFKLLMVPVLWLWFSANFLLKLHCLALLLSPALKFRSDEKLSVNMTIILDLFSTFAFSFSSNIAIETAHLLTA